MTTFARPIALFLLWGLAGRVAAQDAEPPAGVILDDGSQVLGTPLERGAEDLVVGEVEVPKWRVVDLHGAAPVLEAEILINRIRVAEDEAAAGRMIRRVARLRLPFDLVGRLLRQRVIRPPLRPGVTEETLVFGGETFSYLRFVPESYSPTRAWPLWLTLHGTGGDARGPFQAMQPLAARHGFVLAALAETAARRGEGWGYTAPERDAHVALIAALSRRLNLDLDRVYANGWSRGGHGSFDLALRHPDRFAGVGPIIGSVRQRDLSLVGNAFGVRIDAVNGGRDQPQLVEGAGDAIAAMSALSYDVRQFIDPDRGHEFFGERVEPMVEFLLARSRSAAPRRVVFATWEKDVDRSFWVRVTGFKGPVYQPGKPLRIPGVSKMGPEARRDAYLAAIADLTPRVEAVIEDDNVIRLTTSRISRLELGLPADAIDFDRPIVVIANGRRVLSRKVTPDVVSLLESTRRSGDPGLAWAGVLPVSVR